MRLYLVNEQRMHECSCSSSAAARCCAASTPPRPRGTATLGLLLGFVRSFEGGKDGLRAFDRMA